MSKGTLSPGKSEIVLDNEILINCGFTLNSMYNVVLIDADY